MFLYVISSKENPVKIGYSIKPEQRIKNLQTGSVEKLKIQYQKAVNETVGKKIERIIHANNSHKRISGEWFNMTIEEAKNEIEFAIIRYSDELKFI